MFEAFSKKKWHEILKEFIETFSDGYLRKLLRNCCTNWKHLWRKYLRNTWSNYWIITDKKNGMHMQVRSSKCYSMLTTSEEIMSMISICKAVIVTAILVLKEIPGGTPEKLLKALCEEFMAFILGWIVGKTSDKIESIWKISQKTRRIFFVNILKEWLEEFLDDCKKEFLQSLMPLRRIPTWIPQRTLRRIIRETLAKILGGTLALILGDLAGKNRKLLRESFWRNF